jgi:hypothetical protein
MKLKAFIKSRVLHRKGRKAPDQPSAHSPAVERSTEAPIQHDGAAPTVALSLAPRTPIEIPVIEEPLQKPEIIFPAVPEIAPPRQIFHRFLELPAEIRELIYHEAIREHLTTRQQIRQPSLCYVSHQLRLESLPVYYQDIQVPLRFYAKWLDIDARKEYYPDIRSPKVLSDLAARTRTITIFGICSQVLHDVVVFHKPTKLKPAAPRGQGEGVLTIYVVNELWATCRGHGPGSHLLSDLIFRCGKESWSVLRQRRLIKEKIWGLSLVMAELRREGVEFGEILRRMLMVRGVGGGFLWCEGRDPKKIPAVIDD